MAKTVIALKAHVAMVRSFEQKIAELEAQIQGYQSRHDRLMKENSEVREAWDRDSRQHMGLKGELETMRKRLDAALSALASIISAERNDVMGDIPF